MSWQNVLAHNKKMLGVTALAVLLVGAGSTATAQPAATTINACVGNNGGIVRIIDPAQGQTCNAQFEHAVSWAQQGPPGAQGPKGDKGDPGPAGPGGTVMFAFVQFDRNAVPHLSRGNHATSVACDDGAFCEVRFDRPVTDCAYQATATFDSIMSARDPLGGSDGQQVEVVMRSTNGENLVLTDFFLTLNCP